MDVKGAKALKERLGQNSTDEARAVSADVPAHAPPVFHWFGVGRAAPEAPRPEDELATTRTSLFRWLGLGFR
jgi:hypothetical protein